NTLRIERISRAAADQRAGRAGRVAPGRCIRLWTERDQAARPLTEIPEIRRVELSEALLLLKAGGSPDPASLRWLDPPEPASLDRAFRLLTDLGALDAAGQLTPVGLSMAAFPTHPRLARLLLTAGETGCVFQAALVAAIMQSRGLLLRHADGRTRERRDDALGEKPPSDFFRLMRAWSAARACRFDPDRCKRLGIHAQAARQVGETLAHFLRIARAARLPISETAPPDEALQKGLLAAFSDHLARRLDGGTLRCEMVHGRRGVLDRESAVHHAPLLVAAEISEIEGRDLNVILSLATEVQEVWLDEIFPGEIENRIRVEWDRTARRAVARRERSFRGVTLESRPQEPPPAREASRVLADAVLAGEVTLPGWDDRVKQWIERVRFLVRICPDLELPDFDDTARELAIRELCEEATSFRDIKDRNVFAAVRGILTPAQQGRVESLAPDRLSLPGGARGRIVYAADSPPRLTAKIQELYGLVESPRIAMGRVPLTVDILGPNSRSVQITSDLAGFWRETYPEIRKTLQRKYPRHEWR
ncbi:MAG: ATP-dependent helicase C-terminal domain-containing protein, partial [Kiritimatiellia bacterium]|nr:ATP-dependent helicase C-terminal domain-containing protein [Kiritimatiellia bacterium]